jgi:hypothetical protein
MSDKEQKKPTVEKILKGFKKNLFGIEYYYDKFGNLAHGVDLDEVKKSGQYIDACFKEIGFDPKKSKTELAEKKIPSDKVMMLFQKLKKQPKISAKNYEILSRSSFLMLNNYFEYLLSDLLSYHYNKFQKSLNEKKFNLALKEINEYETIEEVTKALITKEVESMMVEMSFDELLEHFHSTLEIDNEKDIINWDIIRECRERRHLIVHNSSMVNKKYILRTKNPLNLKMGEIVHVDKDYFTKACKEFHIAGLLLSYNSWGKWDKEEATEAVYSMLVDSFELLKQKDYDFVSRLTTYTQKIEARDEYQEDFLLRIKVNRLIALKKLADSNNLSKELKKIKAGTVSPVFKLAIAILSDKHDNIIDLVKQAKAINELDLNKYKEWPIYDFIRDISDINTKIEKELKIPVISTVLPNIGRKHAKKP